MKDIIKKERVFNSSIEKVWIAISEGEKLSEWFIKADFKPQVGYHYTFTAEPESGCTQITGQIKKATPYELVYTWVVADTGVETTVSWNLESVPEGTKVSLTHSGISNYGETTAIKMFEDFNGGWENCLNLLNGHLDTHVTAN